MTTLVHTNRVSGYLQQQVVEVLPYPEARSLALRCADGLRTLSVDFENGYKAVIDIGSIAIMYDFRENQRHYGNMGEFYYYYDDELIYSCSFAYSSGSPFEVSAERISHRYRHSMDADRLLDVLKYTLERQKEEPVIEAVGPATAEEEGEWCL